MEIGEEEAKRKGERENVLTPALLVDRDWCNDYGSVLNGKNSQLPNPAPGSCTTQS